MPGKRQSISRRSSPATSPLAIISSILWHVTDGRLWMIEPCDEASQQFLNDLRDAPTLLHVMKRFNQKWQNIMAHQHNCPLLAGAIWAIILRSRELKAKDEILQQERSLRKAQIAEGGNAWLDKANFFHIRGAPDRADVTHIITILTHLRIVKPYIAYI